MLPIRRIHVTFSKSAPAVPATRPVPPISASFSYSGTFPRTYPACIHVKSPRHAAIPVNPPGGRRHAKTPAGGFDVACAQHLHNESDSNHATQGDVRRPFSASKWRKLPATNQSAAGVVSLWSYTTPRSWTGLLCPPWESERDPQHSRQQRHVLLGRHAQPAPPN